MNTERHCPDCRYWENGFCKNLELKPCYPQKGCDDFSNRNKKLKNDTIQVLDKIIAEIANHLQIMDICDVKKVNDVIVQSESVNKKVVLYDSVMQIIDKYKEECLHEAESEEV